MQAKPKDWIPRLITVLFGALYFVLLKPFYVRDYEVPDYFAYYGMGHEKYPAMDGFSSLFIKIASFSLEYYESFHYAMLGLLTGAIVIINFAFIANCKNTFSRILFLLFSFSMSSWYYFDGKVFYEFPFIAFNFAIVLWLLAPVIAATTPSKSLSASPVTRVFSKTLGFPISHSRLLLACLFSGLCISWKSHAIFPIFGLFGLILINQSKVLKPLSPALIISSALFMCLGYISGNFHLIDETTATLSGIKGYPGQVEILHYLFNDDRTVWDHINFFSFNTSVFNVSAAFILLFLCPLFLKDRWHIIFFNFFITTLFLIIINLMSRGYPWHGFPFSLYLLTFSFYLLINLKQVPRKYIGYAIFVVSLSTQLYKLAFIYLPLQIESYRATELSINIIRNQGQLINQLITQIIKEEGPNYRLNLLLKRDDRFRNPPLIDPDQRMWRNLNKNQCQQNCIPNYEIFIAPYPLFTIPSFEPKLSGKLKLMPYENFVIYINYLKS